MKIFEKRKCTLRFYFITWYTLALRESPLYPALLRSWPSPEAVPVTIMDLAWRSGTILRLDRGPILTTSISSISSPLGWKLFCIKRVFSNNAKPGEGSVLSTAANQKIYFFWEIPIHLLSMIWSVSYHVLYFLWTKVCLSPPVSAAAQRLIHTANISTNVVLDKKARFTCKPKFLLVLQTLPEVDKNKTVFTYEEVS